MTEQEIKDLLRELLRASLKEATDAAIQSLDGKVHNTPEGRRQWRKCVQCSCCLSLCQ